MKKAIVLLLALVVVGAFVFAEDAPPATYDFSASATGGWTTNLTQGTSTFINDWDISLKFHLLNNLTKTKGGEGTYGSIEVTHINLNLLAKAEDGAGARGFGSDLASWGDGADDGTGDNLSVTAKIVSGPIEVGLYGAPGTNYENAKYVPLFSKDAGYAAGDAAHGASSDSAYKPSLASVKGLSLKYSFGDLGSIKLSAANTADVAAVAAVAAGAATSAVYIATGTEVAATGVTYTDLGGVAQALPLTAGAVYVKITAGAAAVAAVPLAKGHYLVGGDLALNPVKDMIAITAGGWYDLDSKNMIFSATAKVTAGDLSVAGALDGGQAGASGSKLLFDASANVAYALFEKKDSVNLDFYFANDQVVGVADKPASDLGFKFVDAGGLVAPLSFTLGVFYLDLLDSYSFDPKALTVAESVSYKVALSDTTYVKPYQALKYDLNNLKFSPNKAGTYFNAGVEASLFANTILTADFAYGSTKNDFNESLTAGDAAKDSVLTIKAKVSL